MSANSVCLEELFLGVFVSLGEELLRLVELELTTLLVRGRDWSSELVLQEEKEELLCFLECETWSVVTGSSSGVPGIPTLTRCKNVIM